MCNMPNINHWAQNCPDGNNLEHNMYAVNEISLLQTDTKNPQELKHLMAETWSSALLDCHASKTVCGQEWFNQYIVNLSGHEQENIKFTPSNKVYSFGDGRKIKAKQEVTFPAIIGKEHINIQSAIIQNNIPLSFPRSSMKEPPLNVNFQNDTINKQKKRTLSHLIHMT